MSEDRARWDFYWAVFAAFAVAFAAFAVLRGGGVAWAVIVATPLVAAGLDLVKWSDAHERVCATEVVRHRWLRIVTMGGYSRRTFFVTGLFEIALALGLFAWIAVR